MIDRGHHIDSKMKGDPKVRSSMKRPHGGLTHLEVCQLELDLLKIRYCLLLDSQNLHLLIDHTLSQRGVFRLRGDA